MNKLLISTFMACGLLLLDSPEAAAHEDSYSQHRMPSYDRSGSYRRDAYGRDSYSRDGYRRDHYRPRYARENKMPRWLKRDRSFRHWFKHSKLRKNRRLSWHQLFDIYRWEYSYRRYRRH